MTFKPERIEATAGNVPRILQELVAKGPFDVTLLAEGDSWFDLFTPLFRADETNLLGHLRTGRHSALVDLSGIGDKVAEMAGGMQRRQTRALLDRERFDAWLLSAGGNDLKSAFTDEMAALLDAGSLSAAPDALEMTAATQPGTRRTLDAILRDLDRLVELRDASRRNADTPILLHGYDRITPRDAPNFLFGNVRSKGPWLYPALKEAGLSPDQMSALADKVIDDLQRAYSGWARTRRNVVFVSLVGTLQRADFADRGEVGDWADEIHPSRQGFAKLGAVFSTALRDLGL